MDDNKPLEQGQPIILGEYEARRRRLKLEQRLQKQLDKVELTAREKLLGDAARIVTKDRNATHGDPEDNFADIAALWSTYKGIDFTPWDVAIMMVLVKVARLRYSPALRDHWLDMAGYTACGWECIERGIEIIDAANGENDGTE